ncbi:hypothetical protein HD554DRAFT_519751 [Boletus coccyginus]|nr:hypothetical protein HD554DRAFT_519751 [Boletus coccyginus]
MGGMFFRSPWPPPTCHRAGWSDQYFNHQRLCRGLLVRSCKVSAPQLHLCEHESLRWSQSVRGSTIRCFTAGNEITDQNKDHVGVPPSRDQWQSNILVRISLGAIKGFRTPFLNYTNETFHLLAVAHFIDHCRHSCHRRGHGRLLTTRWAMGLLRSKESVEGNHRSPVSVRYPCMPSFTSSVGPHLMDPQLDTAMLEDTVNTFAACYDGNRQPGLYTRLSISPKTMYPGVDAPSSIVNMINQYLNWLPEQLDAWIVSDEELLVGVQNPSQSLKWTSLIPPSSRLLTLIR